jgi:hypothetical protein
MNPILYSIVVMLILVFFAILCYIGYQTLVDNVDRKVQISYSLNNWKRRRRRKCPAGCVRTGDKNDSKSGWACPNGSFCYNCLGRERSCCCYDEQCADCE